MANFLVDMDTGLPERLLTLMNNLPEHRKTFRPFRDKEFSRLFDDYIRPHRRRIPNASRKIRKLKDSLRIHMKRDLRKRDGTTGEADRHDIWFFSPFFSDTKRSKKRYLGHELAHVVQNLFEKLKPGRHKLPRSYEQAAEVFDSEYYNDPYEVGPVIRDIYYDIVMERKIGCLKQRRAVGNYIRNQEEFKKFNTKNKKKAHRKIMSALFPPPSTS